MKMRHTYISFCILLIYCMIPSQLNAQCYENRHSTNWYDAWTSCEASPNPNVSREDSHWIMYDLEKIHQLDRTFIWNYNDPENLNFGLREVAIDYSVDGSNWINSGSYTIGVADGTPTYQGESGPNLGGIEAQYVLITALSNHGGECFALGEIRIEAEELNVAVNNRQNEISCMSFDVFPNPMKADARIYVESSCEGDIEYQLINIEGKIVARGDISAEISRAGSFNLNIEHLNAGEYIMQIGNDEEAARKVLVKQ